MDAVSNGVSNGASNDVLHCFVPVDPSRVDAIDVLENDGHVWLIQVVRVELDVYQKHSIAALAVVKVACGESGVVVVVVVVVVDATHQF